jgi:GNAT superfamily N-acetyltransferase
VTSGTTSTGAQPLLQIRDLTASDISGLRFGVWSRLSNDDVQRGLLEYPGRSAWLPETLEYAVALPWRHRFEVANVAELSAVRHPSELLEAVVRRCARAGANIVIALETDEVRHPAFYERAHFQMLEEVITYELDCRVAPRIEPWDLTFRLADASDAADRALLVQLDHAIFPWLWWNSDAEFLAYLDLPGVELFIGYDGETPVSYIGITSYLGWGHLDRIGVLRDRQGGGLGAQALSFAIKRLTHTGALRIGLSTQKKNERSRRLYERFGFKRVSQNDYRLYGRLLQMPAGVENIIEID